MKCLLRIRLYYSLMIYGNKSLRHFGLTLYNFFCKVLQFTCHGEASVELHSQQNTILVTSQTLATCINFVKLTLRYIDHYAFSKALAFLSTLFCQAFSPELNNLDRYLRVMEVDIGMFYVSGQVSVFLSRSPQGTDRLQQSPNATHGLAINPIRRGNLKKRDETIFFKYIT